MTDVLGAIVPHGLEAVVVAVELALESGRPSAEHVMNVLARLKSTQRPATVETALAIKEEPQVNVTRYDHLRTGVSDVD
jgi:hypothetical protein